MHLVQHARPTLLLSGRRISAAAIKQHGPCHRTFTDASAAVAELAKAGGSSTEEFITTETVSNHDASSSSSSSSRTHTPPILQVSNQPQTRSNRRLKDKNGPQSRFADTLRSRAETHKADEPSPRQSEMPRIVEEAISRDRATQDNIIQTLHHAIVSEPSQKGNKKRKSKKKRSGKTDASALFAELGGEPKPTEPVEVERNGWKAEEWLNDNWGKDGKRGYFLWRAIQILNFS